MKLHDCCSACIAIQYAMQCGQLPEFPALPQYILASAAGHRWVPVGVLRLASRTTKYNPPLQQAPSLTLHASVPGAQLAFLVADRSVLGGLRQLSLASGARQCIPLGCRGQHPDLSHLTHLSIGPDIALCVNFLAYLSGLRARGLTVCRSLGKARCSACHSLWPTGTLPMLGDSHVWYWVRGFGFSAPHVSHLTHLSWVMVWFLV